MGDLNIIDQFTQTFGQYIDSGFGLLGSDVRFLTTILVGIDITLAGLWWALDADADLFARLLKKVLYVSLFALILNNFQNFANIIYQSFSGLGLHASANTLSPDDLLRPGKLAGTGFTAAKPLLDQASTMLGFPQIFGNFITVCILLVSWFLVIVAFFILAVQLFITIIEFKLTSLAGFTLVPFALWNKTSFLAERVLGAVIGSGIKVMVLAVVVGIGSSFFGQFTTALQGQQPDVGEAMSLVLASLALVGLGIFAPGIAAGLVSGAPQLGAGAAIGTVGAAVGALALTGGAAAAGVRGLGAAGRGGMAAIRSATSMGFAAATAYQLGQAGSGSVGAGIGGMARAAGGVATQGFKGFTGRVSASLADSARQGREAARRAMGVSPQAGSGTPPPGPGPSSSGGGPKPGGGAPPGGSAPGGGGAPSGSGGPTGGNPPPPSGTGGNAPPAWAQKLRAEQRMRGHADTTTRAIKEGDRPGAGAHPDLSTEEE
jgi:type IV secretion system protein TrbL